MLPSDYPPQEPFSDFALPYVKEVTRRGAAATPSADVLYGEDPYQSIAVHAAENPNGAVFAFVHGGGWTSGYKEHMNFMAPAFTAAGITFCAIGYRLAPRHLFPDGLDDVADAIAWIYTNIGDFGGNPDRLFIGGHSAGGHYTPLLAVTEDWRRKRGLPGNVVKGCLPISGVFRFGEGSGLTMRPRFLGPEDAAVDGAASPVNFVTSEAPPFLIAYGTEDFPHLKVQADDMVATLRDHDVDTDKIVFEGRDHFGASFAGGEPDGPWVPRALAWMATH
ncbi:MAG: alpha/beta hydrolase [Alphaproteobacteria bacterium]